MLFLFGKSKTGIRRLSSLPKPRFEPTSVSWLLTKLDRFSNWAREPCTLSEEKILFLTFSLSFSCLLIGYASERSLFIGSCLALLLFMSWVPIKGLIFVSSCLTWRQKSSKFILAPSLEEDWKSFFMLLYSYVIFQRILFC